MLKSMITLNGKVDLMSARIQGNLKIENLESKITIVERSTGK